MLKIVERIQKCNHPKLNPANKTKMEVRESCQNSVQLSFIYRDFCEEICYTSYFGICLVCFCLMSTLYYSVQVFFDILIKYIDNLLLQTPPQLHKVDALVW